MSAQVRNVSDQIVETIKSVLLVESGHSDYTLFCLTKAADSALWDERKSTLSVTHCRDHDEERTHYLAAYDGEDYGLAQGREVVMPEWLHFRSVTLISRVACIMRERDDRHV